MSSRPDPLRVMRAYDGDLTPEEQAEVLRDQAARLSCEGLEELGDLLRAMADERGQAADDIADLVMARVRNERFGHASGPLPGTRYWPVLAAAAGIALVIGVYTGTRHGAPPPGQLARAPEPSGAHEHAARPQPSSWPSQHARGSGAEVVESEVAIESVDFGGKNGTIFLVPGGEAGLTPVVWLVDDPGERARVEKL